MPRGFKGVRQASAAIQAKRDTSNFGPSALYFSLQPDEEAIVRFLEEDDDISWCWVHDVPVDGRNWPQQVPCLDQDDEDEPCPGCEQEMPRKFKGFINLIWFDGPVYKRDKDNRLVKGSNGKKIVSHTEDQVAVWSSGVRLFEELDETNDTYKGLRGRRFKVKRKGKGLDTKYVIKPEDIDSGKQDFSDEEAELDAKKYDLAEFMKIPSYEDFMKILNGGVGSFSKNSGSDDRTSNTDTAKKVNPFMRNRSKA